MSEWLTEWPTAGMREAGDVEYWDLRDRPSRGRVVARVWRACLGCGKESGVGFVPLGANPDVIYCTIGCYEAHR